MRIADNAFTFFDNAFAFDNADNTFAFDNALGFAMALTMHLHHILTMV
jgi:hypothetical protein